MKKLMFAMAVAAAGAASAVSFSYQGALKTAEGGPIPAKESNKTIEFRLYDDPTGGTLLWGRAYAVHLDTNGLFNVELSDTTGSPAQGAYTNDLAWVLSEKAGESSSLYIALFVNGSSGEISPRQKLLNVPAAGFAADVRTAKRDFTVAGTATINGAVTAKNGLTVDGDVTVSGGTLAANNGLTVSGGTLAAKNGLSISGGTLTLDAGVTLSRSGDPAQGIIPRGVIVMWSGATPPAGWAICNGENHTPDLRGRFIVGYDPDDKTYNYNVVGNKGGEPSVKLTEAQMPEHSHYYFAAKTLLTTTDVSVSRGQKVDDKTMYEHGYGNSWDIKHSDGFNTYRYETSKFGSGNAGAHENRPPYYVLAFIMKL